MRPGIASLMAILRTRFVKVIGNFPFRFPATSFDAIACGVENVC
jgi:hypothetical protein